MNTALNVIEILNTVTDENLARRLLGDVEEVSHLARDLGERNPATGDEEVDAVLDDAHEEVCAVDDALARLHSVAPAGSWAERDSQDSPQLGRLRATVERILALGNPYFLSTSN